eukprot:CAMPEP_0116133770 /NCGR_PEP_ID=MMETSP0329-20121206/10285_1 /TAXON_ID=697910 /ORGANISM="Pseudo-nitzschia arenysensis, Strain B593" /LENGTH=559 /DNA_ID=CAMNT_0003628427 /DNA_START=618 /DNA_END=2298 /DNA_ORIENTATION=-
MKASSVPESNERKLFAFPIFPNEDENFHIDEEDYNALIEILVSCGVQYKLSRVQQMVKFKKDDKDRRIRKLIIPDHVGFFQPIPACIGKFKELTYLELGDNCSGPLPDAIADLENLRIFSLRASGITSIPSSIAQLKNLVSFNISHTKNLFVLPPEIGGLAKLKTLNVNQAVIVCLPPSIRNCRRLSNIDISATKNLLTMVRKVLSRWKIEKLDFSRCSVYSLPLREMDELFARLCHDNPLHDSIWGKVSQLKDFGLLFDTPPRKKPERRECEIGAHKWNLKGWTLHLPPTIRYLKKLRDLDLSCSRGRSLPEEFGDLCSLEKLNLRDSRICFLPDSIGRLQKLRQVDLCSTHSLRFLPKSFEKLRNLTYLNLCNSGVLRGSRMDSMEKLAVDHPMLTTLVFIDEKVFGDLPFECYGQSYLGEAAGYGYRGRDESKAKRIVKKLRIVMVERMQLWCSPKLWPLGLKQLACEFERHTAIKPKAAIERDSLSSKSIELDRTQGGTEPQWLRVYRKMLRDDTSGSKLGEKPKPKSPILQDADAIYHFLRKIICQAPHELRRS